MTTKNNKSNSKSNASKNSNSKNNASNASKNSNSKNNASNASKNDKRTRVTIFDKSATSVLKALGALGYNLAQARAVCAALASAELKNSTIATALSDGRNSKYNASAATLTKKEQAQLARIAKQAN